MQVIRSYDDAADTGSAAVALKRRTARSSVIQVFNGIISFTFYEDVNLNRTCEILKVHEENFGSYSFLFWGCCTEITSKIKII